MRTARVLPASPWVYFGLALGSRLSTWAVMGYQTQSDAATYLQTGTALLTTGRMSAVNYMPLYPLLQGLTGGPPWITVLDILFSALATFPLMILAKDLTRGGSGPQWTGLLWAAWPHSIFYALAGTTESLFTTLFLGYLVLYWRRQFSWGSVVAVLSLHVRPAFEAVNLLLLALRKPRPRDFLVLAGTYLVLMAPWWLHNQNLYGRFVRLNLGDGIVLYSGNNPLNHTGGGTARVGDQLNDVDFGVFAGLTDPIQRNDAMKRAAKDFVIENPVRSLKLAVLKFARFWRPWPYAPEYGGRTYWWISVLTIPALYLFSVLGLRDWIRAKPLKRHWREALFIATPVLSLTAIHVITFGSIRYRFPLEPLLLLFAVRGGQTLGNKR